MAFTFTGLLMDATDGRNGLQSFSYCLYALLGIIIERPFTVMICWLFFFVLGVNGIVNSIFISDILPRKLMPGL